MKPFIEMIEGGEIYSLNNPMTMQVNITKKCNLACKHCHMDSNPNRTEDMNEETAKVLLKVFKEQGYEVLDLTGGSPEMSQVFKLLIDEGSKIAKKVIVRSNLTLWETSGYEWVPKFLADRNITIFASLPSPKSILTNKQRGVGVYERVIRSLKLLTNLGYGEKYELNLVHNPNGAFLPPAQEGLEREYRRTLGEMGIKFSNLYNITNMPLGKFSEFLNKSSTYDQYMNKLYCAFNPDAVENIMCRNMISINHDGTLYDCDFHLAEGHVIEGDIKTIFDLDKNPLHPRKIKLFDYCYGCTAGAGSSCGGEIA